MPSKDLFTTKAKPITSGNYVDSDLVIQPIADCPRGNIGLHVVFTGTGTLTVTPLNSNTGSDYAAPSTVIRPLNGAVAGTYYEPVVIPISLMCKLRFAASGGDVVVTTASVALN